MHEYYQFKHLSTYPQVSHAVTLKNPQYPHAFSLALHTGEDAQSIVSNRQTLAEVLEVSSKHPLYFIVANQTHSANIKVISQAQTKGWESAQDAIKDCDALITNIPNVVLTILTADCVPILLYDPQTQVIAIIHAGWKGTQAHITQKTIKKMQEFFHANPKNIIASIAPSIGKCCYEVGHNVAKHFLDSPQSYAQHADKYMLDLPHLNKTQLLQAGVNPQNIELSNICTACEVERFFSYRKEQGCSGRFMSVISLQE